MEDKILTNVQFNIHNSTSKQFLDILFQNVHKDSKIINLSKYFIELSLLFYKLIKYKPSLIAAGRLWLAMELLED